MTGYFKDQAKTAAAFFDNPPWAPQVNQYPRRCYNTGDLVRYNGKKF
jgi:acyl-CoA synthetase (AMP-forming)/AMP-acid ligase II